MTGRANAFDEGLARVRDDAALRALAELDSLEPSRMLDRAVLEEAREAAAPRGAASARARRSQRLAAAVRWGVPAAIAAAAVCALVMPRSASRSMPQHHAAEQRLVERMHSASSSALATRVSTAPVDLAPSGSGNSQRPSTPKFIEASQALERQAAWIAPSRVHPPELIESVAASTVLRSPPPPARQRRTRDSGLSGSSRAAPNDGSAHSPRETSASR